MFTLSGMGRMELSCTLRTLRDFAAPRRLMCTSCVHGFQNYNGMHLPSFQSQPKKIKLCSALELVGTGLKTCTTKSSLLAIACYRSIFVLGPFASEFSDKAVNTVNAIALASGIGITPVLSLMLSYVGKKKINLIWMCRDSGLIEYILHKVDIHALTKKTYALIYYTGKRELVLPTNLPPNLFIFRSRPNLEETISGIVTAIVSGKGLSEDIYEYQMIFQKKTFNERIKLSLSRVISMYSVEEMFEFAFEATTTELTPWIWNQSVEEDSLIPQTLTRSQGRRRLIVASGIENHCVSLNGIEAMISSFFGGIGEYSCADIANLFKEIDTDNSGLIDKDEFENFINLAISSDGQNNTTIKKIGDNSTLSFLEGMASNIESPLDDWSMFYCGNSDPIVKTLQGIKGKYHIRLGIEKFDW